MIKKIQQYLLLHHPVIWNIRLVPMLLILFAVHVIFFAIGYFSGDTAFTDQYYSYYSPTNDLGMLYFVAILVGILILIGWLVMYMRNNAFRIFYPRKTSQLYFEWILIFVVTIGIAFLPSTLTLGRVSKWRSVASYEEAQENLKMLESIRMLIPNDDPDSYNYNSNNDRPIPIPDGVIVHLDEIDLDKYSFEYDKVGSIVIKGYKGASFLFYSDYEYNYYLNYNGDNYHYESPEYIQRKREYAKSVYQIKSWLINGQKDSIISLMSSFLRLQDKHNLKANVDLNRWFKTVYNPPYFPVSEQSRIYSSNDRYSYDYYSDKRDYYIPSVEEHPFLAYQNLCSGYECVVRSYENVNDLNATIIICLCIALLLSVFVFSFRVTTGKSWLIALIASGVILFVSTLIMVAISEALSYNGESLLALLLSLFWIALFISILVYLSVKIKDQGNKGRSNAPMNIFLWLLPCICPLIYFGCYAVFNLNGDYYERKTMEKYLELMFIINAIVTIAAMWFIAVFVRKWKSIPEE